MKKYLGGTAVPRGVYLNLATWEYVRLNVNNPELPGAKETAYLKVPGWFTIISGPLIGLVFIIFLPMVGIVGIISVLTYKIGRKIFARQPVTDTNDPILASQMAPKKEPTNRHDQ